MHRMLRWLPLAMVATAAAPAHATHVGLPAMLNGAQLVAERSWYAPFNDAQESLSQVWFTGDDYVYLYSISNPGDIDYVMEQRTMDAYANDPLFEWVQWSEATNELFELQVALPESDVAFGILELEPSHGRFAENHPSIGLHGGRLTGRLGGANLTTADFYLRSAQPPVLASALTKYSTHGVMWRGERVDLGHEVLEDTATVFAPAAIPEPGTLLLLGSGCAALAYLSYRHRPVRGSSRRATFGRRERRRHFVLSHGGSKTR